MCKLLLFLIKLRNLAQSSGNIKSRDVFRALSSIWNGDLCDNSWKPLTLRDVAVSLDPRLEQYYLLVLIE